MVKQNKIEKIEFDVKKLRKIVSIGIIIIIASFFISRVISYEMVKQDFGEISSSYEDA
jgi:hypothetical protein